jgi:hypothetical protein
VVVVDWLDKAGSREGTKVLKSKGTVSCSNAGVVRPSCPSCMDESTLEPEAVPVQEGGTLYHLHWAEYQRAQCGVTLTVERTLG